MSVKNDTSPPLRDMKQEKIAKKLEREANENPKVPATLKHKDAADPVVSLYDQISLVFANWRLLIVTSSRRYRGEALDCCPQDRSVASQLLKKTNLAARRSNGDLIVFSHDVINKIQKAFPRSQQVTGRQMYVINEEHDRPSLNLIYGRG